VFFNTNKCILLQIFINCHCIEAITLNKWHIGVTGMMTLIDRCFWEHFGVLPLMVACLWNQLVLANLASELQLEDVLWALYFLKQNPTDQVGATFCKCLPMIYSKRVWKMVDRLSHLNMVSLDQKICCHFKKMLIFHYSMKIKWENHFKKDNSSSTKK